MFANTSLGVMNLAFPDVCMTPVGPVVVPLPYPNIAVSTMHVPSQFNVFFGGGIAENLMTQGTLSNGDNAGVVGGVASGMMMGPDRYIMGSFKFIVGGVFASRLTSMTGQNGMMPNSVGMSLTPSQVKVLVLG